MEQTDLISIDPNICHGQACIKGTRIMVSIVLDCLAAGMSDREILDDYPSMTAGGIRAAAAYGAALARGVKLPSAVAQQPEGLGVGGATNAIVAEGVIDAHGQLRLDEPVTSILSTRVSAVLLPHDYSDISETEWLHLLAINPVSIS